MTPGRGPRRTVTVPACITPGRGPRLVVTAPACWVPMTHTLFRLLNDRIPPRGGVISWRPYKYFCVGCGKDSTAALPPWNDAKGSPSSHSDRARLLGSYAPHPFPSCHDRIPPRGGVISWRPYKYFCVGCGKDSTAALPPWNDETGAGSTTPRRDRVWAKWTRCRNERPTNYQFQYRANGV